MTSATLSLPLPQLALIQVTGADAEAFLQGQLSNDVRRLSSTQAQLTSLSSAKGRLLAILHAWRMTEGFLLEVDRSLLEPVLKRLRLYVMRSKVTLAEATHLAVYGLAGADAVVALGAAGLPAPAATLECSRVGALTVTRRVGSPERYTVTVPSGSSPSLRTDVGALIDWKRLEIAAGMPTIFPATQDRFVAQMVNLDALGGISFDKGCYTGQEVIARVHYRGAVKRHMSLLRLSGPAPEPGAKLDAGEVVDAVAQPDGSALALVVTAP